MAVLLQLVVDRSVVGAGVGVRDETVAYCRGGAPFCLEFTTVGQDQDALTLKTAELYPLCFLGQHLGLSLAVDLQKSDGAFVFVLEVGKELCFSELLKYVYWFILWDCGLFDEFDVLSDFLWHC